MSIKNDLYQYANSNPALWMSLLLLKTNN